MKKIAAAAAAVVGLVAAPAVAQADSYSQMFEAVDYLAQKYGVVVYTDAQWLESGTYAQTQGDVITFNLEYITDPQRMRSALVVDVASGFHPGQHCTPEQAVAAHEFAHVLDNLTGHTADYELAAALANGLTGEVSGYALTSYDEAIAEAFMAVECDDPTPAEVAIYTMLTT